MTLVALSEAEIHSFPYNPSASSAHATDAPPSSFSIQHLVIPNKHGPGGHFVHSEYFTFTRLVRFFLLLTPL